ncbi:hypothetical protein [Treponema primitia]|uniref:hypothetical protein n=1 Tax=Treponema primitia TaxID=88058 RepID=UPI000255528B|nr:hypothetical protein [Treponema primitia]
MADFDVSKPWVILIPAKTGPAKRGAEELSRIIDLLRRQAGLSLPSPGIIDDSQPGPATDVPEILLNCSAADSSDPVSKNGFAWRTGTNRIEIYGNSPRGLCNGLFNFLAALGFRWPEPGKEEIPRATPGILSYPLAEASALRTDTEDPALRKRLLLTRRKNREAVLIWAARNCFDALVVPVRKLPLPRDRSLFDLAAQYALDIELSRELSSLISRKLFFFRRELFRMEEGRRKKEGLFCVTNPNTITLIQKNAARLFSKTEVTIFHLWPSLTKKTHWCSCPSCRAFSPEEQNRIAINAAADSLIKINPLARLSFYEPRSETTEQNNTLEQRGYIAPRPNTFRLNNLPEAYHQ